MFNFVKEILKFDIEKTGYITTNNYQFANQIWHNNYCYGFYFPEILQTYDFYFVKIEINRATGEITEISETIIDNSFKLAGYFEAHELASNLENGFYFIKAKLSSEVYKTSSIFEVKGEQIVENFFINANDDYFVDADNNKFEHA